MWEIVVSSVQVMLKNKVRSILTMLGVIIGILALIVIVVLGNAFSRTITKVTDILYKNDQLYLEIVPSEDNKTVLYDDMGNAVVPDGVSLDKREIESFLEGSGTDSYLSMGGILEGRCSGSSLNGRVNKFMVSGGCSDCLEDSALILNKGRDISRTDEKNKASVALIADISAAYLFDNEDPIGKELNIKYNNTVIPVVIIGTYKYIGLGFNNPADISSLMFINRTYLENNFSELLSENYWNLDSIVITLDNVSNVDEFKESLVNEGDKLLKNANWTVEVETRSEQINAISELVNIILKIVFVIAAIALFIGGIGIMNVMLITVTERTNEIGTRKAIGASNFYIIFQFLCESFSIAFTGTVIGVILGLFVSKIVAKIASMYISESLNMALNIGVSVPIQVLFLAILTSVLIGVVFGLYPAIKAVKMQIVDALRYE